MTKVITHNKYVHKCTELLNEVAQGIHKQEEDAITFVGREWEVTSLMSMKIEILPEELDNQFMIGLWKLAQKDEYWMTKYVEQMLKKNKAS